MNFTSVETKKGLLENLTNDLKDINEKETIFEIQLTEDQELNDLKEGFEPFHRLWEIASNFKQSKDDWMNKQFNQLQKGEVEKAVDTWYRDTN